MAAGLSETGLASLAPWALIVGVAVVAAPVRAATFHVPGDFATIQAALDSPRTGRGDEVVLGAPVYAGTGNVNLDFHGKAIRLRSASGDPAQCRIDCANAARGFVFQSGETRATIVEGIEIAFGFALFGGGLSISAGAPTIVDCRFVACIAVEEGGAVASTDSAPALVRCAFDGNFARSAGGAMSCLGGAAELTDCTFIANVAALGTFPVGGAAYLAGRATVTGCTFAANRAGGAGGGVYAVGADPEIRECHFTLNEAPRGAGAYCTNSGARFTATLFELNEAADAGGGIFVANGVPRLEACTFRSNVAGLDGGGAASNQSASPRYFNCLFTGNAAPNEGGGVANRLGSAPLLVNCTFAGNDAGESARTMVNDGSSAPTARNCVFWDEPPFQIFDASEAMTITTSDVRGGWSGAGSDNIDADPLFRDAPAGDFRLGAGSPCADRGNNALVPTTVTTDLAGNPRFVDDPDAPDAGQGRPPLVDLGPLERQLAACFDVNADGAVGFAEILAILATWGPCAECPGDLDGDGAIGFADLLAVLAEWGSCGRR
jgi:hypothetical protein